MRRAPLPARLLTPRLRSSRRAPAERPPQHLRPIRRPVMAQHVGTAGRPTWQTPTAFVAGTLFAVAAMVTVVILALALGVNVGLRDDATAHAGAAAAARTYDGRLDPIEGAYVRRVHAGPASPPASVLTPYDSSIDPQEQAYIDDAHSGSGAAIAGHSTPARG